MKTLAAALITTLFVFALSTAWVEVIQPRLNRSGSGAAKASIEIPARSNNKRIARSSVSAFDEGGIDVTSKINAKSVKARSAEEASLHDLTRERLLAQFDEVKKREVSLMEREDSLNAICADIRRELAEVDEIRRQSARELAFVERTVTEAASNAKLVSLPNPKTEPPKLAAQPRASADSTLAGAIQDLIDGNNIKAAAALLSGMQDRKAAKLLSMLRVNNPTGAAKVAEQVRVNKQTASRIGSAKQ